MFLAGQYHRQPRLTAWFGDFPYTYSGLTLQPFEVRIELVNNARPSYASFKRRSSHELHTVEKTYRHLHVRRGKRRMEEKALWAFLRDYGGGELFRTSSDTIVVYNYFVRMPTINSPKSRGCIDTFTSTYQQEL